MKLFTNDITGDVIVVAGETSEVPPGHTAREADMLPAAMPGKRSIVRWDGAKLTRIEVPDPVPPSISAMQIRLWLVDSGRSLASAEAAIRNSVPASERDRLMMRWEYTVTHRRVDPLIAQVTAALGMSEAAVDQMFREAAVL